MKYRKLGKTDMEVSAICMGTWAIGTENNDYWGSQEVRDSLEAIQASLDVGVNFFDTAEDYGNGSSEEVLGRGLGSRRKDVILTTKISPKHLYTADEVRQACERSLQRLNTDVIDLYQIHWPNPDVPVQDTLAALESLKEQGKIRAYGVSNFGISYLEELFANGGQDVVSNQLPYSLLWRVIEHWILPRCIENNVGVLAYSPLLQGLLTGKYHTPEEVPEGRKQMRLFSEGHETAAFEALGRIREICDRIGQPMELVAAAWVLAQEGITSIVVGSRNAGQAREDARAADLVLTDQAIKELRQAGDELRDRIGDNADMWEHETRMEKEPAAMWYG